MKTSTSPAPTDNSTSATFQGERTPDIRVQSSLSRIPHTVITHSIRGRDKWYSYIGMETTSGKRLVLCDAHVHIYDCFDLARLLESAWSNFSDRARSHDSDDNFSAALLLSEGRHEHWFNRLAESAGSATTHDGWSIHGTDETETLAVRKDNREILLIAGRQIVTAENLEVLALATAGELADGSPIGEVINWAQQAGSIIVIPWGFGKWWGKRGRILTELLASPDMNSVLLGDNSGRPWFLGHPRHFAMARQQTRHILPGSDPLPFATEDWRPGSVGLSYWQPASTPVNAQTIRRRLTDSGNGIDTYMHCEKLFPFMRNQVAMQLRKRLS